MVRDNIKDPTCVVDQNSVTLSNSAVEIGCRSSSDIALSTEPVCCSLNRGLLHVWKIEYILTTPCFLCNSQNTGTDKLHNFEPSPIFLQSGLCRTWSVTGRHVFSR